MNGHTPDSRDNRDPVDQSEADDTITAEQKDLPADQRDAALTRDNYRCRACNTQDEQRGGMATLHVHHREDDPTHCEYHALQNLTTLCPQCHRWLHRQPDSGDLPDAIQDRLNGTDLEPTRIGILQYLARNGPATTSTITANVDLESDNGVRQALYGLMAADQEHTGVTGRLVAKDRFTNEYGLPWQVPDDHDARGVIPVSGTERRGRLLDEFVRRVDEYLPDSIDQREQLLSEIVNRDARHVEVLRRRGEAFQFPFDEWAQPDRRSPATRRQRVIEAVATLADHADNVAAEPLVGVITEPLAAADNDELVKILQEWVQSDHAEQVSLGDETFTETAESDSGAGDSDSVSEYDHNSVIGSPDTGDSE